jgi:hypothetical protein
MYYTVIIPFEPDTKKRTHWHPTEPEGPFAELSRGAFDSPREAHAWAKIALGKDATYNVKPIDGDAITDN